MGTIIFDQFTYLHLATGIIIYFWGITFKNFIILHTLFEIIENTNSGMYIINNNLSFWPGGKPQRDTNVNIIGDTIGAIIGWMSAYYLDKLGSKYGWYELHIK